MAIYYLCSGFDMEHSFVNKFGEMLSVDVKQYKQLALIPSTDDYNKSKEHLEFMKQQLAEAGMCFDECTILTDTMSEAELKEQIRNSDMIYMMGGYPRIQRHFIRKHGLERTLHEFDGVILGISAGAMNMSKYIIMVTDGENNDEIKVDNGLGLVDFSIFPHCAFSGETFAESFFIGSDLVCSQKLITACKDRGEVYCLQNKTETGESKISFIRVENKKIHFVSIHGGSAWRVTEKGFVNMNIGKEHM